MNDGREAIIVDYDMGNLYSVQQACARVELPARLSSSVADVTKAAGIILPGVGAFGEAMQRLRALGLVEPLQAHVRAGRPFLGICLGMQLLMTESEEFGSHRGLGLVPGCVRRFPASGDATHGKVPQIQWNRVRRHRSSRLLEDIEDGAYMYFLHSFYVKPESEAALVGETNYCGIDYCSALEAGNVWGTQFHPEKSMEAGLNILRNFRQMILS